MLQDKINSELFHLHCVLGVRDGMLVDSFELPAVLKGRKGTLFDSFDLNIYIQRVRNMCWLIHLTFRLLYSLIGSLDLTPKHGHIYHKLLPHLRIDGLVIPWGPLPRVAST